MSATLHQLELPLGASQPPPQPLTEAKFDGVTYDRERDHQRWSGILLAVWEVWGKTGRWMNREEVVIRVRASGVDCAIESVGASMRDLRKEKRGGYIVERREHPNGGPGFQYRVRPDWKDQILEGHL
jgi:hypothetical protein